MLGKVVPGRKSGQCKQQGQDWRTHMGTPSLCGQRLDRMLQASGTGMLHTKNEAAFLLTWMASPAAQPKCRKGGL